MVERHLQIVAWAAVVSNKTGARKGSKPQSVGCAGPIHGSSDFQLPGYRGSADNNKTSVIVSHVISLLLTSQCFNAFELQ